MRALVFYPVWALLVGLAYVALRRSSDERLARFQGRRGAALAAAVAAVMFVISEPRHLFEDFTDAYYAGGAAVLAGLDQAQRMFASGVHGFVNIPIVAVLFVPFALFPERVASVLYTLLGLAACLLAFRYAVEAARLDRRGTLVLALAFLLNGPLFNSLREGNTTHFTLLAVTLALLSLREGREWRAGVLLGAAALFKLPLLIFGVYFLLRGKLRVLGGAALVLGGLGLASVALFGFDVHVLWYEKFVAGAGRTPIAAFNVQSFAAVLARAERGGAALCDWNGAALAPTNKLISQILTGALLAFAVGVIALGRKPSGAERTALARELEFLIVLLLACTSSPLAWTHYYAWLLLPAAFLLAPGLPAVDRTLKCAGVAGLALASLPVVFPLCPPPAWLELPYVWLSSHYLAGGLLLLVMLGVRRFRLERSHD